VGTHLPPFASSYGNLRRTREGVSREKESARADRRANGFHDLCIAEDRSRNAQQGAIRRGATATNALRSRDSQKAPGRLLSLVEARHSAQEDSSTPKQVVMPSQKEHPRLLPLTGGKRGREASSF